MLDPWKESYDEPRQCIKKQRHYFANKVCFCLDKAKVFPSSHVQMQVKCWIIKKAGHPRIDAFVL